MKKTIAKTLSRRKYNRPNGLVYRLLVIFVIFLKGKRTNTHITREVDMADYKGKPIIIVGNHQSRLDYIYGSLATFPRPLNYVVGYNEFFRSHLRFIFWLLNVIPKKNFTADYNTIRGMVSVLQQNGAIMIFPEGMSTITGENQPVAFGSGKMLKHFGVPVLQLEIKGGYLTNTKHCLDERKGRVDVNLKLLFSPEQLETMSAETIHDELNKALYHNDYAWNKQQRVAFIDEGKTMAKMLHTMLYRCPRCGKEAMESRHNTLFCSACDNNATINKYYDLIPGDSFCVIPETPIHWWREQRGLIRDEIAQNADFMLTEAVELGVLPRYRYLQNLKTYEAHGQGSITLTRTEFSYEGQFKGERVAFSIPTQKLPTCGMCVDITRFSVYHNGRYYEFNPSTNSVAKWLLSIEEAHRFNGGKWLDCYRNVPPESIGYSETPIEEAV